MPAEAAALAFQEIGVAASSLSREVFSSFCEDTLNSKLEALQFEDAADGLKALCEAAIAFRHSQGVGGDTFALVAGLLLSDATHRMICRHPHSASHILSTYAYFPPHVWSRDWTDFLLKLSERFPSISASSPPYRHEEAKAARRRLLGRGPARSSFSEFVYNAPWLTRDQVYAFTHKFFYVSDYGKTTIRYGFRHAEVFIEDAMFHAWIRRDIDVLLELMICYASCAHPDGEVANLFERIVLRMLSRNRRMSEALWSGNGAEYQRFYHQYLLFVIYADVRRDNAAGSDARQRVLLLDMTTRYRLGRSLRSLNVVRTLRLFGKMADHRSRAYYGEHLSRHLTALKIGRVFWPDAEAGGARTF